jgi:uncharacterized membrane protein
MKKEKILIPILMSLFLAGCSSSDTSEGTMEPRNNSPSPDDNSPTPNPGAVTYSDDIRLVMQSNCTSCHSDPPTQNAPMSLTTLEEVRSAINNRGLLTRINSSSNPMPPTGRLPAATRQLIADWADLGFPE